MNLFFILLVLKQVNVAAVVIILMTHMQKYVFLMLRTNETRHIKQHETCKCKCRLDASVCDNKQRWNNDKFQCECKELIDKGICNKRYIWNPTNCKCECNKSCDFGECLDYETVNVEKDSQIN